MAADLIGKPLALASGLLCIIDYSALKRDVVSGVFIYSNQWWAYG